MISNLTTLIKPALWSAFWFCVFFGPLYYILPFAGWNPWWALLLGTAGAGVYLIMAGALVWFKAEEDKQ